MNSSVLKPHYLLNTNSTCSSFTSSVVSLVLDEQLVQPLVSLQTDSTPVHLSISFGGQTCVFSSSFFTVVACVNTSYLDLDDTLGTFDFPLFLSSPRAQKCQKHATVNARAAWSTGMRRVPSRCMEFTMVLVCQCCTLFEHPGHADNTSLESPATFLVSGVSAMFLVVSKKYRCLFDANLLQLAV